MHIIVTLECTDLTAFIFITEPNLTVKFSIRYRVIKLILANLGFLVTSSLNYSVPWLILKFKVHKLIPFLLPWWTPKPTESLLINLTSGAMFLEHLALHWPAGLHCGVELLLFSVCLTLTLLASTVDNQISTMWYPL